MHRPDTSTAGAVHATLWMTAGTLLTVGTGHTFTTTCAAQFNFATILVQALNSSSSVSGTPLNGSPVSNTTSVATSLSAGSITPSLNDAIVFSIIIVPANFSTNFSINSSFTITDSQTQ